MANKLITKTEYEQIKETSKILIGNVEMFIEKDNHEHDF